MMKAGLTLLALAAMYMPTPSYADSPVRPADDVISVDGVPKPQGATGYYFDSQGKVHWVFGQSATKPIPKEPDLPPPPKPIHD